VSLAIETERDEERRLLKAEGLLWNYLIIGGISVIFVVGLRFGVSDWFAY